MSDDKRDQFGDDDPDLDELTDGDYENAAYDLVPEEPEITDGMGEIGDLSPFSGDVAEDQPDDDPEYRDAADEVYLALLDRIGEGAPQPRLAPTRRAVELLGDPHRAYPIVHITGTNGKTSTSRIAASILTAYGLRTGLLTSPHLTRINERIVIDGRPIANRALVSNWHDIQPFLAIVDAELAADGEPTLTFVETLTVLAFASFADAPVDVAVIEVGMGGEWDSTNVGDGAVAVFTPIALDHEKRLGSTTAEIARTKSGIIKPLARVVSAVQTADAAAELVRASELTESTITFENAGFALEKTTVAVGGQLITVQGLAGRYEDQFLPLFGDHQAHNAALAIAAVESFLGGGTQPLVGDLLAEGLGTATSPGRLQIIGTEPTVIVDAAHNPHGAASLAEAIPRYFTFDQVAVVIGVLADKDARGIVSALAPIASAFFVTQSTSDRAVQHSDLTDIVRDIAGAESTDDFADVESALDAARQWANAGENRAVVVSGSITLIGEAMTVAAEQGWAK
ncbi:folylpolyglutamate synthase/dihydrofolate synthase family protein [soil metagenome]